MCIWLCMKRRFKFLIGLLIVLAASWARGFLIVENDIYELVEAEGYHDVIPLERVPRFDLYRGCNLWDAAAFHATASDYKERRYDLKVCISWPFPGSTVRVE